MRHQIALAILNCCQCIKITTGYPHYSLAGTLERLPHRSVPSATAATHAAAAASAASALRRTTAAIAAQETSALVPSLAQSASFVGGELIRPEHLLFFYCTF